MKKTPITVVGLASCLLCAGCGAVSEDSQNVIAGSVSEDARSEPQLMSVSSENIAGDESELSAALEKLVLDYQSGDWDGWVRSILGGRYLAEVHGDYIMLHEYGDIPGKWTSSLVNIHLPVDQNVFSFVDSGTYTDVDGEWYTYWLGEGGVYCYELGSEVASWGISDVERGQTLLIQVGDYAPCVWTGEQIIYCAPGGKTVVLPDDSSF